MSDEIQKALDDAEAAVKSVLDALKQARRSASEPNEAMRLRMTALRKDRRAKKLCANCGQPSPTHYHCLRCRRKHAA